MEAKSGLRAGTIKSPVSRAIASRKSDACSTAETRSKSIPTKAQPAGLAATASAVYVPTASGLEIHPVGGTSSVHPGAVTAAAAFGGSDGDIVAFGSGAKVTLATVNGTSLKVLTEISDNRGDVLVLAFSKDGNLLASGDVSSNSCSPTNEQSTGRIVLIDVTKKETLVSSKWTNHTGRITSLAFSENGERIVSGGLDEAIYVWHVKKTLKNIPIKVSLLFERVWRLIGRTLILVVLVVYLGLGVMRRLSVLVQMGVYELGLFLKFRLRAGRMHAKHTC